MTINSPEQDAGTLAERFDAWTVRHPDVPGLRMLLQMPLVLWRLGLGPLLARPEIRGGRLAILTVTGRSSGRARHAPVVTHEFGGRTYLWCPYGDRSQWYRNVVAQPVVTVQSAGCARSERAVPVEDPGEAVAVISELRRFDVTFLHSYLTAQGIADDPDDLARNVHHLHIRRLDPTEEEGPPGLEADLVWLWGVVAAGVAVAVAASGARRRWIRDAIKHALK